jgi:hypothetical protein
MQVEDETNKSRLIYVVMRIGDYYTAVAMAG